MNEEYAIEVKNVKKKFKIYYDKSHQLKEKLLFWKRNKFEEKMVLQDVSFRVKKGEAIGLVGHNGCGKSTLLKLLTQIMYPDDGTIEMSGRVSSLLELGAGFHPDMSGRENIYINASIFGLSRSEIDKKMSEIIAFSELSEYIDNPVRTYSSGMYMRLAFSVAINVNADILLIDEILAVGDANFQVKCFNKLMEIKEKGTTIVIVSHSLGQIEQICERSIWIHEGLVRAEGTPRAVHREYLDYMGAIRDQQRQQKQEDEEAEKWTPPIVENHTGSGEIRLKSVYFTDKEGKVTTTFKTSSDIVLKMEYEVFKKVNCINVGVSIIRNDGLCCYGVSTKQDDIDYFTLDKSGIIEIHFPHIALLAGQYYVSIGIEDQARNSIDFADKVCEFNIYTVDEEVGAVYLPHKWIIN